MRLTCHCLTCKVSFDVPRAVVFFILGIVNCVAVREVFSTQPDIYDGTFFTEIERLKTVNLFHEKLHCRCLPS